ncbi:MAG: type II CAAX endopeptidase family protein [Gemmatimonadaceae bacterium]
MSAQQFFYTEDGALRGGWRIIAFFVASSVATLVAASFAGPLVSMGLEAANLRGLSNQYVVELIGLIAGTAFVLQVIDKRPWRDVWLGRDALRPAMVILGFAVGALAIGLPILSLIEVGWLREAAGPAGAWSGAALRVSLMLLPAALVEELLTRGYVLSVLRESWGWTAAIVLTSVVFGLIHLENNGVNVMSVSLVIVAGFFLAVVVYVTKSLYAAWMAHFAWNWTMAVLFHTAVSGYPLESPSYRYVDAGPDWATGGEWGPEGGLPAGLGMGAGMGVLFFVKRRGDRSRLKESVR